jgi:hypothetical protein
MEPLRETTEKEESVAAAGAPWIGVDLDGTLARSGSWQGPQHIGKPVPLMLERVKLWLSQGYEVKIMTARASVESYIPPVKEWLKKHGLPELEVTNQKDFDMIELWDDRGVQVIPNTGRHVLRPSFLTNPKAPPLPYESNEETCFVEPRQAPPQVEARQDGAGEGKVGEGPGQS